MLLSVQVAVAPLPLDRTSTARGAVDARTREPRPDRKVAGAR